MATGRPSRPCAPTSAPSAWARCSSGSTTACTPDPSVLYRVTATRYLKNWQDAFAGEGSFRAGGRWSSAGTRMVYASTHLSLATLEVLVHCNARSFRDSRISIRCTVPDELIQRLPLEELPDDWNSIPESVTTQRVGDAWVSARGAAGLIVPSATLPDGRTLEEQNVLLNPLYPDFLAHLQDPVVEVFDFDARVAALVRA